MEYEKLKQQITQHEACRLSPYKCTAGKWTIGVGRNLDDVGMFVDEQKAHFGHVYKGQALIDALIQKPIDKALALWMLEVDITTAENDAAKLVKLDEHCFARQGVIINMAFNLGYTRFSKFKKLFKALEFKDYDTAAQEMKDSLWFKQVGNRAIELCEQMKTGEWQL